MGGLVIKAWKADISSIDDKGNCVSIIGRESGLVAWVLSWLRVDPTTTLLVGSRRIDFSTASLAGTNSRLIPIENVCSSYYGYYKPWKAALGIILGFIFTGCSIQNSGAWPFMTFFLIGTIVALVYYFSNRMLTLGFVENSGIVTSIVYKRSIIENIDINESQARNVCTIVQDLIEKKEKHLP
jgi:hypothetical protein